MRTIWLVCTCLVFMSVVAEARTWTDITGAHRLDAQLVSLAGSTVQLQGSNGRTFSIALAQLSTADRKFVLDHDRNLQNVGEAGVPQTLTAAVQSAPSGGLSTRQNPAPLTFENQPPSGQAPLPLPGLPPAPPSGGMPQAGAMPGAEGRAQPPAGSQQPTDPGKDKRIFNGCRSTFHLNSRDGTAAYWLGGKHYLAKLTWFRTDGDYVYFHGSGEGGVQAWALFDIEASGSNRVYAWTSGGKGWQLFDHDSREMPN